MNKKKEDEQVSPRLKSSRRLHSENVEDETPRRSERMIKQDDGGIGGRLSKMVLQRKNLITMNVA